MTDRELLELAAKAAGIDLQFPYTHELQMDIPPRRIDTWENWSPLTDDGDALRLAGALSRRSPCFCMQIIIDGEMQWTGVRHSQRAGKYDEVCMHEADPLAATRRAIVLAAAEVGKQLTQSKDER